MFFTAAYGVDEKLNYFSANVNNASLCDYMKEKYIADCHEAFQKKRDESKYLITRLEKQLGIQNRTLAKISEDLQRDIEDIQKLSDEKRQQYQEKEEQLKAVVAGFEDEIEQRRNVMTSMDEEEQKLQEVKQVDLIDEDGNRLCLMANPADVATKYINLRGCYALVSVDPADTDSSGEATPLQVEVPQVSRPQAVEDFFASMGAPVKQQQVAH